MNFEIHSLAYLVYFFGIINLIRMIIFRIGADRFRVPNLPQLNLKDIPTISVIIPAHNEEGTIIRAVDSVFNSQLHTDKLNCIVVDNNSTDNTAQVVREYKEKHPHLSLKLIHEKQPGKAHALNAGCHASNSDLIMCLDADSYLHPQSLARVTTHFAHNPQITALAANAKISPRPGILNLIQRFEYLICYQMKRSEYYYNINYIIGGIGSTFRRQAIQQLGYYDTNTITEDIDLTLKLLQQGNLNQTIAYDPHVIAYTEHVLDLKSLIRQRFRWKWGRYQTFLKNTNLFFSRHSQLNRHLSWFYLPYALISDLAYFFEPILIGYILGISIIYQEPLTILSALILLTTYNMLNILSEDTLTNTEKIKYCLLSPFMYFLLYIISLAEYIALIKSWFKLPQLKTSISQDGCSWIHVARATPNP